MSLVHEPVKQTVCSEVLGTKTCLVFSNMGVKSRDEWMCSQYITWVIPNGKSPNI